MLDPTRPGTLYAGAYGSGVFKSTDAAATWAAANEGLTNLWTVALAMDPTGTRPSMPGFVRNGVWQRRSRRGAFYTVPPCRAVDSRTSDEPALAAGTSRTFTLVGRCGIPAEAVTVSLNVTVTEATSPGHLRLYPGDTSLPATSSLNFSTGDTRANSALSLLGPAGDLTVFSRQDSGSVHVIVDVTGYFR